MVTNVLWHVMWIVVEAMQMWGQELGLLEISVPSAHFCCELKIALRE